MKEATSASEDKRVTDMERKVTWQTVLRMDRRMIGDGKGSGHGPVTNIMEIR